MAVADVGAGFGASTVVFAKWIGNGRVFATDIGARQLRAIRDYVEKESLSNVTIVEGAPAATTCAQSAAMRSSCVTCITTSPKSTRSTRACSRR